MAVDTLRTTRPRLVVMVIRGVIAVLGVTIRAERVPLPAQGETVGLVAITAGDPRCEHATLRERPVDVHLVQNLAVGVIEPRFQKRRQVPVEEWASGFRSFDEPRSARVARGAGLDLGRIRARRYSPGHRLSRRPNPGAGRSERNREGVATPARRVRSARPVAGFARHVEFFPGRLVAVGLGHVAPLQARRVTLGAHEVPPLGATGPVERVARRDGLVWNQGIPALPPLGGGSGIPGDAEDLESAVGLGDQELLERVCAENVFHPEIIDVSLGPLGANDVIVTLPEKPRGHAKMRDFRSIERTENVLRPRGLHGPIVVRTAPAPRDIRMTSPARRCTDVLGLHPSNRRHFHPRRTQIPASRCHPKHRQSGRGPDDGQQC